MVDHSAMMLECLETMDLVKARKLWAFTAPHLQQPKDDNETAIMLHMARTQTQSIDVNKRIYSHAWLTERKLPSQLPDNLKPLAERVYPRIVEGVGIACMGGSEITKPIVGEIRKSMEDAVNDAYAEKRTDPTFVRERMFEARKKTIRQLIGR